MYVFPAPPRWPKGRGPFDAVKSKRGDRERWPFVLRQRVRARSGQVYDVAAQRPDRAGWSFVVVEPVGLDLWCSYLHLEGGLTRLVIDVYIGPAATRADRDRVWEDFGLRSTLRVSNV